MVSDQKSSDGQGEGTTRKKPAARIHSKDRDMGSALRSVYQKTVEESVPDEMLALLGKLD